MKFEDVLKERKQDQLSS